VRLCGSSGTNPFAAIAAGVACLWGPAHGGANEACLNMLEDIQKMGGVSKVGEFMEAGQGQELRRQADGLRSPRLQELRPARQADARDLRRSAERVGPAKRPAVQAGQGLEKIALEDDYFVSRKLYPNVDFYSGIVQRAIGIPVNLFTGVFAWPAPSAGSPS
jgi:citrate synthase